MASADFFLKIEGIDGESDDASNKNELQLISWSWGATNSGSSGLGTGAGSGKVNMQDFHFVVQMSKASPVLMQSCATGKHIGEAKLTCRKPTGDGGQKAYLKVTFNDLVISSYQTGASDGSNVLPVEQISFNYTKIKMEYDQQDAKGNVGKTVTAKYDTKANKVW
ncbi:Hcp family type VI secretion system effector [Bosea sp. (in: a-proteobacteria)]|uniref:Hcp family type VI secretion system effector n=1 Tax=Bosea sp. (in: a-proteobacteria) TaxID=1871050 RepID=UPI003B3A3B1A